MKGPHRDSPLPSSAAVEWSPPSSGGAPERVICVARAGLRATSYKRDADLRLRSGLGLSITGAARAGKAVGRCCPALVVCSGVYPASGSS